MLGRVWWRSGILLLALLFVVQCRSVGGTSALANTTYRLSRTATNTTTNSLLLSLPTTDGYVFSLTGDGFTADVELGAKVPPQPTVTFTYTAEGVYTAVLTVYQSDGSIIIRDTLKWEYSLEVPPDPIVTFSEVATNDDKVLMLVALNKGANTKELGVTGDLASGPFAWLAIPDTGAVPVVVSADDGMKNFEVKYRNIFGTESRTSIDLSILKKSIGPTNCSVTANGLITATKTFRVQMSASNDGPLYYIPVGDVKSTGEFTKFTDSTVATVELVGEGPVYKVTMQVRDVAENYCPATTFNVTVDPTHTPESIQIVDKVLWSDDPHVVAMPIIDHVSTDVVEMYIHGDIEPASDVFTWIPYAETIAVQLSPVNGNRFVRAKFRLNGVEFLVRSVGIYLAPFLQVTGASTPYTLTLSSIIGTTGVTIGGCTETYQNIPYQATVSCTAGHGATISATYLLNDGTQVTRNATTL